MAKQPKDTKASTFWRPPLLKSESLAEFEAFHRQVENEIKPRRLILQGFVRDYCYVSWEIQRLWRCNATIIEAGSRPALQNLLDQLVGDGDGSFDDIAHRTEEVSELYFRNATVKPTVLQLLGQFGLDESALIAQSVRDALPSLEAVEKMIASLERRRTRLLHQLDQYGEGLAQKTRESATRNLEREDLAQAPQSEDLPQAPQPDVKIAPGNGD